MTKQTDIKTFDAAAAFLAGGRDKGNRPAGNNTRIIQRDDDTIAVRLHCTDVVTYHRDGRIVLDCGGWRSVTTKDRMNTFSPVGISQSSGEWWLSLRNPDYVAVPWRMGSYDEAGAYVPAEQLPEGAPHTRNYWLPGTFVYADGITFRDGEITGDIRGDALAQMREDNRRVRRDVKKFCASITAEAVAAAVTAGYGGDCLICATRGTSCLQSHIDEGYIHLTLLTNAQAGYWLSPDPARVRVSDVRRLVGKYMRAALLTDVATR